MTTVTTIMRVRHRRRSGSTESGCAHAAGIRAFIHSYQTAGVMSITGSSRYRGASPTVPCRSRRPRGGAARETGHPRRRARTTGTSSSAVANRSRGSFARPSASTRSTSPGSWREQRGLRRDPVDDVVERRRHVLAGERGVTGHRAVEDRGQRVDVGAVIDVLAARLLGRHVGGGADDVALGQRAATRRSC